MAVAGTYWFLSKVQVRTGYGWNIFGWGLPSGLIIVPLIAGIVWLFMDTRSWGARIMTFAGLLVIVAALISSVTFRIYNVNLYEWLLMLIMMFGGGALLVKTIFGSDSGRDAKPKRGRSELSPGEYSDLMDFDLDGDQTHDRYQD